MLECNRVTPQYLIPVAMKIALNEVMTIMSIATRGEVFIQFGRKTKLEKKICCMYELAVLCPVTSVASIVAWLIQSLRACSVGVTCWWIAVLLG